MSAKWAPLKENVSTTLKLNIGIFHLMKIFLNWNVPKIFIDFDKTIPFEILSGPRQLFYFTLLCKKIEKY